MPFTFEENSIVLRIAGGFGGGVTAENAGVTLVARASAISAGDGLQFTDDGDQTVTLKLMGTLEVINDPGTTLDVEQVDYTTTRTDLETVDDGLATFAVLSPTTSIEVLEDVSVQIDNATGASQDVTLRLYTSQNVEVTLSTVDVTVPDGETVHVGRDQLLPTRQVVAPIGKDVNLDVTKVTNLTYTVARNVAAVSETPAYLR